MTPYLVNLCVAVARFAIVCSGVIQCLNWLSLVIYGIIYVVSGGSPSYVMGNKTTMILACDNASILAMQMLNFD